MPNAMRQKYQYYTNADLTNFRATEYTKEFTSLELGIDDYINPYLLKTTLIDSHQYSKQIIIMTKANSFIHIAGNKNITKKHLTDVI